MNLQYLLKKERANMKKIFRLDNPIYQNITKFVDFLYLSVLLLIFSSLIVTIGPAFSAGYYTYNKIFYTEEDRVFHTFWHSFKENLSDTLGVSIVTVLVLAILYLNYQFCEKGLLFFPNFKFFFLILGILLATYFLYYLCLAARFENTVKERLIVTLSSAVLNLPTTLILMVILIIAYFLATIVPITFLLLPGLLVATSHRFCEMVFKFYARG